jgi:nicotinamidase-related amidase
MVRSQGTLARFQTLNCRQQSETMLMKWQPSARTIHLCVDMQILFSKEGLWPTAWMDRTLPTITEIAAVYAGQTVFTRFIPPRVPEEMVGSWRGYYERWREVTRAKLDPHLLELMPPLAALCPPAAVIDKPVYSPFYGWRLPALLRERRADLVVITGAETDVCVLATVLGAIDYGFPVLLVEDAVCSSSDTGHDALLTLFRERFSEQIDLACAEEVLANQPSS